MWNNLSWLGPVAQLLIAFATIAMLVGTVKSTISNLSAGLEKVYAALHELTTVVSNLSTASAVNSTQHDEISRRLTAIERSLGEHSEAIRVLRTRSHIHSTKIMELDPAWKPYREED